MNSDLQPQNALVAFQIKGDSYTLTTLELHATDSAQIKQQLHTITRKAPNFFQQTPVILALETLAQPQASLNLGSLRQLFHEFGMLLVAVRGGTDKHRTEASLNDIAWLPAEKIKNSLTPGTGEEDTTTNANVVRIKTRDHNHLLEGAQQNHLDSPPETAEDTTTMIIDRPVRSGQQVYAPGDLIVLGPVSTGSELLAGGHIHVYGPLRGRALAGINGNHAARLFCRQFEAELISICGHYKLPAQADKSHWGKSVVVSLTDENLHITEL
ncbi:septum site-determining protein MinC [Candidatus Sororendozoicomonas aggregata]|uniref:septum site-determining protein MinC n=1 Tax=Candidatus Sororendozoicomonas aggregata TaxID=3073239 RepID=UPI002ED3D63F